MGVEYLQAKQTSIMIPSVLWHKVEKSDEQKDWSRANVETQQEAGTVFHEALQKRTCADGCRKPQKQILSSRQLISQMTWPLCSTDAICYACIFSSALK